MKINGYELIVVCANFDKNVGTYGDIYESVDECKKAHPGDQIIYGYCLKGDADTPDWFATVEEAVKWASR